MNRLLQIATLGLFLFCSPSDAHVSSLRGEPDAYWVAVKTKDKFERSKLADLGVSIEQIIDGISYGFAPEHIVPLIQKNRLQLVSSMRADTFSARDFPERDSAYHNYSELTQAIDELVQKYPRLVRAFSIGKTVQGKDIWAIRINNDDSLEQDPRLVSARPGVVYIGGHHAREHLSVEIPLMLAQYLAESYQRDPTVTALLEQRDIFIVPNLNVDGSEHDIASGTYLSWRKNRNDNGGARCKGVDLNRNYGYQWGTGGSSKDLCSDVYMGKTPFSEPETQAVKKFVEERPNLKILLSFHTFSELILYPWGHKYDAIERPQDLRIHKTMAETMAQWNRYTPQQSSDLYIASGDTTDWSYGALGIVSFTFELSPRDLWSGGGFYPGADMIQKAFNDNLKPSLYLLDLADNPARAFLAPETTLFYGRVF